MPQQPARFGPSVPALNVVARVLDRGAQEAIGNMRPAAAPEIRRALALADDDTPAKLLQQLHGGDADLGLAVVRKRIRKQPDLTLRLLSSYLHALKVRFKRLARKRRRHAATIDAEEPLVQQPHSAALRQVI